MNGLTITGKRIFSKFISIVFFIFSSWYQEIKVYQSLNKHYFKILFISSKNAFAGFVNIG